jgi:hypothetical protein
VRQVFDNLCLVLHIVIGNLYAKSVFLFECEWHACSLAENFWFNPYGTGHFQRHLGCRRMACSACHRHLTAAAAALPLSPSIFKLQRFPNVLHDYIDSLLCFNSPVSVFMHLFLVRFTCIFSAINIHPRSPQFTFTFFSVQKGTV